MKLIHAFFERSPDIVARELLGCFLVRKTSRGVIKGKIVETEAYGDASDLASHARFGVTARNKIMYGPAGLLYVYHIYGIFYLSNIICEKEGKPSAVLLRSAEIVEGIDIARENIESSKFTKVNELLATGPGKLSLAFDLTKEDNYTDLIESDEIYLEKREGNTNEIISTKRVGIDYAGKSKDLPWRFYIKDNPFVSKK